MTRIQIEFDNFERQNIDINSAGEFIVRRGLKTIIDLTLFSGAQKEILEVFSIQNPNTLDTWYYLFSSVKSSQQIILFVLDEAGNIIYQKTINTLDSSSPIYCAVINNEILFTSTSFNALYGIIGGGIVEANKVESIDPDQSAIDIPRGIVASWFNRSVIASGNTVFFSDPDAPRTFVGTNVLAVNGTVFGLHVNDSGTLLIVTSSGVFGLPADAAASSTVIGVLQKLSTYSAFGYKTTAFSSGGLFGLSQKGVKRIDVDGEPEILLGKTTQPRFFGTPVVFSDLRFAKLLETRRGLAVSFNSYIAFIDISRSNVSFWTQTGKVVSIIYDDIGNLLLANTTKILTPFSTEDDIATTTVRGLFIGEVETPSDASPTVRYVTTEADGYGTQYASVRGKGKQATTPQYGDLYDVALWTTGVANAAQLRSRRHLFSERTDDAAFEIGVDGCYNKIGNASFEVFGSGKKRP